MPGSSATREALSRSMADLNFDPAPHKRRAQQKRTKRDNLSQSCSAFNFVLDPSEIGDDQARRGGKGKSGSGGSGSGASNKPSYSDLIMDATSKAHAAVAAASATSPTSVIQEESERDESERLDQAEEELEQPTTTEDINKPSRSIPSAADFNRSRNRSNLKTRSSHDAAAAADPLTPGGRARRNRKARSGSGKNFSKSCHMSFADFGEENLFDEPDFAAAAPPAAKSPQRVRRKSSSNMDRFSKSFSDFGDWDLNELTSTPTRRGRKKPARSRSSEEFLHDEMSGELSGELQAPAEDPQTAFDNSFTEMDLMNGTDVPPPPPPPPKRSSKEARKERSERRFSHSFSDLDFSQDNNNNNAVTSTPRRRRRSSIDVIEVTTPVQTSKVSVDEFHAAEEEEEDKRQPVRKARSSRGGTPRQNSGMRLRRSNTTDGATRPSRSSTDGARRTRGSSPRRNHSQESAAPTGSPGKLTRSKSQEEGTTRAPSRDRRSRRRSSMDAKMHQSFSGDVGVIDSPGQQRRVPRRTKSGDVAAPIRGMRDKSSTISSEGSRPPPTRRTPRRTKSSDGSAVPRSRATRSTSMGHGPAASDVVDRSMNQSMSAMEFSMTSSPRSTSANDRLAASRAGFNSSSSSSSKPTGSSTPNASSRRKTPLRSKSHDGSGGGASLARKASRDRERADQVLRGSSGRSDRDLRTGERSELRSSRRASRGASNRRAMAHNILEG